ncbi:hypothetical protein C0075_12045 [Rhizobium sp. KAs_5_22]|nr:hypothetical protein C0075_12045 [Rhizobium sp. KAs_5_22]
MGAVMNDFSKMLRIIFIYVFCTGTASADADIDDQMASTGKAQVIIQVNPSELLTPQPSVIEALREVSKLLTDSDKSSLRSIGTQPLFTGIISKDSYLNLAHKPGITVVADTPSPALSSVARSLVGLKDVEDDIAAIAVDGDPASSTSGYAVAVIDSGFDIDHPFIEGAVLRQACFSTSKSPSYKVKSLCPNGYEIQTAGNAASPCATLAIACDHGTHVAGLISGKGGRNGGAAFDGIAPRTPLILITSFTEFDDAGTCIMMGFTSTPCIGSFLSDQIEALEYVRLLSTEHFIAAVNFSQGMVVKGECSKHILGPVLLSLLDAGVPTVAAAGNNGKPFSLLPACISTSVNVAASDQSQNFAGKFPTPWRGGSNYSEEVDIVAPGVNIISAAPHGKYIELTGTSMSVPIVSGTLARIRNLISPPTGLPGHGFEMAELSVTLLTSTDNKITIGKTAAGVDIVKPLLDVSVVETAAAAYLKAGQDQIALPAGADLEPNTQVEWGWVPANPGGNRSIVLSSKPFTNSQIKGLSELIAKEMGLTSFQVLPQNDPTKVIVDSEVPIDKTYLETLTKQLGNGGRAYDDAISTIP